MEEVCEGWGVFLGMDLEVFVYLLSCGISVLVGVDVFCILK